MLPESPVGYLALLLSTQNLVRFPEVQLVTVTTRSTEPGDMLTSTVSTKHKAAFPTNTKMLSFVIIDREMTVYKNYVCF